MTAVYPGAIKVFQTFQDEFDIAHAGDVNEIHDEVVAIESTLGTEPQWTDPTGNGVNFPDVATFLRTLYAGAKALPHTHAHDPSGSGGFYLTDLGSDTHQQYLRTDGTRALTGNMNSPDPLFPANITTKNYTDQGDHNTLVAAEQFATNAANSALQQAEAFTINLLKYKVGCVTEGFEPINGPVLPNGTPLTLVGGTDIQQSDANSLIYISFEGVFRSTLYAITPVMMDEAEAWPNAGPGFGGRGYGVWPQFTSFHVEAWGTRSCSLRLGWVGDAAETCGTTYNPRFVVGAVSANNGVANLGTPPFSPLPGYWCRLNFLALGY